MALELKASRPHNALLAAVVVAMLLLIAGAALTSSHVVGLRKLRVTVSQVSALTAAEESGGASHGIKVADYLFLSYRGDGPNDTTLLTKSCGNVLGGSPSAVWQRQHKVSRAQLCLHRVIPVPKIGLLLIPALPPPPSVSQCPYLHERRRFDECAVSGALRCS